MATWQPDKTALTRPVYHSLAEQFSMAIQEGLLEPGDRLPPQRDLASDMQVSQQTISRAYEELRRRDLVQGEIGRGTFVRTRPHAEAMPFRPARPSEAIVDLSIFKPVVDTFHEQLIKAAFADLGRDAPAETLFSFRPNEGLERHRSSGVQWLKMCGIEVEQTRVLVTNGVTQGTTAALLTVGVPGCTIATEAIGHHSLAALCSSLGMKLKSLPIDDDGILPDAFERACRLGGVKALYLMPSLAGPTVLLMPGDRRRAIVDVARRHGVFIIENDVLGPLVADKPEPLAGMAPELTFYLTSFTKVLLPGLRTGYMAVPSGLFTKARNRLLATGWMATPLVAEIACRWVVDGTARKLLLLQRRLLQKRNRIARRILGDREYRSHRNGLHVWLTLPGRWRPDPFVAQALEQGVAVAPAGPFLIDHEADVRAIRVSLGSAGTAELARGLRVLKQLMEREAEFTLTPF